MILALLILALLCVTVVYVAVVGFVLPPQWSLYAYVALWVTVPKAFRLHYLTGGRYDLPHTVTVFNVLEAVAAAGILAAMLVRPHIAPLSRDALSLQRLSAWLLVSALASFALAMGVSGSFPSSRLDRMSGFLADAAPLQERILPVLSILYAAIFLFGCVRFIRTRAQAEPLLWLLAFIGTEMAIERMLFVNFHVSTILPPLERVENYVIQGTGRFNSLVFSSFDFVGVFAIMGLCSALYLALTGRRIAWLMFAACWVPVLAGYQRTSLVAAVLVVAFVACCFADKRNLVVGAPLVVVILGAVVLSGLGGTIEDKVGSKLGGDVRSDYFSTEQTAVRLAFWDRAADTFGYLAPFGTGAGAVAYGMNFPIPSVGVEGTNPLGTSIYASLANGNRTTNPHNIFIEFIVEQGVAGLFLLAAFLAALLRIWTHRIRRHEVRSDEERRDFALQACAFAMALGIGFHGLTEATPLPYFVYTLPIYLAVMARAGAPVAVPVPAAWADRIPVPRFARRLVASA